MDVLDFVDVGFTEKQSKLLVSAFAQRADNLVTKDFLRAELAEVRAEIAVLRADVAVLKRDVLAIKRLGSAIGLLIIAQIVLPLILKAIE